MNLAQTVRLHELEAKSFSADELRTELSKQLDAKMGASSPALVQEAKPSLSHTYIEAVYPEDHHLIYSQGGKKYKHAYKVGKSGVKLHGDPQEVEQQYVNVQGRAEEVLAPFVAGKDLRQTLLIAEAGSRKGQKTLPPKEDSDERYGATNWDDARDESLDDDVTDAIACEESTGDLEAKQFSDKKRKKLAKSGKALPHGGYPIETVQDLKNAVQAIGRAKDPGKTKRHIIKRARALGRTDLLPDSWKISASEEDIDAEMGMMTPASQFRFIGTNGKGIKLDRILPRFKNALKAGWACKACGNGKDIQAKAPPGWEDTVKKMKQHKDIDNPFALANWMHDQGYRPGGSKK